MTKIQGKVGSYSKYEFLTPVIWDVKDESGYVLQDILKKLRGKHVRILITEVKQT
jgi:hypothetical protein